MASQRIHPAELLRNLPDFSKSVICLAGGPRGLVSQGDIALCPGPIRAGKNPSAPVCGLDSVIPGRPLRKLAISYLRYYISSPRAYCLNDEHPPQ